MLWIVFTHIYFEGQLQSCLVIFRVPRKGTTRAWIYVETSAYNMTCDILTSSQLQTHIAYSIHSNFQQKSHEAAGSQFNNHIKQAFV